MMDVCTLAACSTDCYIYTETQVLFTFKLYLLQIFIAVTDPYTGCRLKANLLTTILLGHKTGCMVDAQIENNLLTMIEGWYNHLVGDHIMPAVKF